MTFFKKNSAREQKPRQTRGWLVNISVRWKLNLIIIILMVGFAGIFYSAYIGLQTLQYHISNLYNSMLLPATALDRADIALGNIQTQLETIRSPTRTRRGRLEIIDRITSNEDIFITTFQRYNQNWATTLRADFTTILKEQGSLNLQEDETATILKVKKDFDFYLALRTQLQTASGNEEFTDQSLLDTTIASVDALRTHLRHLTDLTRQFAEISKNAAQTAYNKALFGMGLTLAASVTVGLILAFVVSQSIANRLGFLTRSAQSLQQGHLEEHATTGVGGRDEIAQMAVAFDAMGEQLTQTLSNLEQRVTERTLDLEQRSTELSERTVQLELANERTEKRSAQFQAIAQVGRAITSIQNLRELLPYITQVASEQLGFYHVGIFLFDKDREYAVLSAANSEGGKRMLERGHKLKVGQVGIVGYVASLGKPRIALDTGADAVFFTNPDLPNTHSEMALPLNVGSGIIGVLDVQSEQPAAFGQEDIELLTIMADQIGLAIQNSQRFEETQKAMSEAEAISKQYMRQEWQSIAREGENLGYYFTRNKLELLANRFETADIIEATQSGQSKLVKGQAQNRLTIPVKLRGQVIGVLSLHSNGGRVWKNDVIDIAQAVADRVAMAIENARLLESSQDQAARERTVSEITSKIGASVNLRNVLQIAVEELGRILPGSDVIIQLESGKNKENDELDTGSN
jgi:GAF domain-containing protein/HAMP domain-containing protein